VDADSDFFSDEDDFSADDLSEADFSDLSDDEEEEALDELFPDPRLSVA
jgi:hypothetical protein